MNHAMWCWGGGNSGAGGGGLSGAGGSNISNGVRGEGKESSSVGSTLSVSSWPA